MAEVQGKNNQETHSFYKLKCVYMNLNILYIFWIFLVIFLSSIISLDSH